MANGGAVLRVAGDGLAGALAGTRVVMYAVTTALRGKSSGFHLTTSDPPTTALSKTIMTMVVQHNRTQTDLSESPKKIVVKICGRKWCNETSFAHCGMVPRHMCCILLDSDMLMNRNTGES
ncbi:hypothetical protein Taro_017892 [Colocasia esculenta]|uniref:Uncharacterized protein n=1 Tax=Colocasia esculenta TaxID=4460 RepID=A0A843V0S8_COLES|nr:hypothetical protein [Colocasia esculenta]